MSDLNEIMEILRENSDNCLYAGASPAEIKELERVLQASLPPSFRQFLAQSDGATLYQSEEILGSKDDPEVDRLSIQSAAASLRDTTSLPENLIPFHFGAVIHCFDTQQILPGGEYRIVGWTYDGRLMTGDDSQSFAEWLENYAVIPHQSI